MAPTLVQVFQLRIFRSKDDILSLGATHGSASRFIALLTSGFLSGSDIQADLVQGGSDWLRFDPNSQTAHLDARMHFRDPSGSGDCFYVHFTGLVRFDAKIALVMAWSPDAATTASSDHYSFIHPVFEVSNARHKWMEQTAFVGHGHYYVPGDGAQAVEYEIYKLVSE